MNQFDMENEQVFQIVHDNPRRRGVIRDVGYIINGEQAKRFAAYEAAKKRGRHWVQGYPLMCLAILAVICITVATLI